MAIDEKRYYENLDELNNKIYSMEKEILKLKTQFMEIEKDRRREILANAPSDMFEIIKRNPVID